MFKNSRKAYRIYRRLNDEEKAILESKKVSGKYSVREWIRKLSHIAVMDAYADKARQGLKITMILLAFPAFFIILFAWNEPGILSFILLLLVIPSFGFALYLHRTFKKIDLGNQLRFFIIPTLRLLSSKVHKRHKLDLEIDLALPDDKSCLIHQEEDKSPADRRFIRINTFHYQVPWLKAKVPLADGSLLLWENEDVVKKRKVVKARKGKRKTKYKIKHCAKIQLMLPRARYALAGQRSEDIHIEASAKYHIINLKGKEKTDMHPNLHGDQYKSMNPKYFTALLVKAYQQVEPIKPQTV